MQYLFSTSFQLSPSSTKSSAYRNFSAPLFLTIFLISSMTITNKNGLRTEPWWTPTFTSNSSILVHFCNASTSLSITPFFLSAPKSLFWGYHQIIKCFSQVIMHNFFSAISYFFQHLSQYKDCIGSSSSKHEPHLHFTYCCHILSCFSNILLITFMPFSNN